MFFSHTNMIHVFLLITQCISYNNVIVSHKYVTFLGNNVIFSNISKKKNKQTYFSHYKEILI